MNVYLVRFRFHVLDGVARRTWYDVEAHAGPESAGAHWVTAQGLYAHWVSYVVLVPAYADADDYINENLEHWADQAARWHFPRLTVRGDWERKTQVARSRT